MTRQRGTPSRHARRHSETVQGAIASRGQQQAIHAKDHFPTTAHPI
ncbi:MAG: hypothetical protein KIS91_13620 [Anaerolineae bacterium]|nr:hypothetical protein [Anaerolineae bacterium]